MTTFTPGYSPVSAIGGKSGTANSALVSGGARTAAPFPQYFGKYKVTGTTIKASDSSPYAALVQIAPEAFPNWILAQQRTTPANNTYTFNKLAAGNYIVTGVDESLTLDATAHALVAAVAM